MKNKAASIRNLEFWTAVLMDVTGCPLHVLTAEELDAFEEQDVRPQAENSTSRPSKTNSPIHV